MKRAILAGLAAGVAVPAYSVYLRYRRDMNAARARLASVDRHVIPTDWGAVEYAERGHGEPVLVLHGIFHNCVGGLVTFPRDPVFRSASHRSISIRLSRLERTAERDTSSPGGRAHRFARRPRHWPN